MSRACHFCDDPLPARASRFMWFDAQGEPQFCCSDVCKVDAMQTELDRVHRGLDVAFSSPLGVVP